MPEAKSDQASATQYRYAIRDMNSVHVSLTPHERLDEADLITVVEDREKALAAIAWDTMESDPQVSHAAFAKLPPDGNERMRLIQHYAMRLATDDPSHAMDWAEGFESPAEFSAAIMWIAVTMAETDPQAAANLLTETEISGRNLDVAIVEVMQRWAAQSPADAVEWVIKFPEGEVRSAGLVAVSERWLASDAAATFKWYEEIQDTNLRQQAARAIEGLILQQEEAIRDQWLAHANAQIRDDLNDQRSNALEDVGNNIPKP